jgi:hypothetical protein
MHRGWLEAYTLDDIKILISYMTKVELLASNDKNQIIRILESDNIGRIAKIPYYLRSRKEHYSYLCFAKAPSITEKIYLHKTNSEITYLGERCPVVLGGNLKQRTYLLGFPVKRNIARAMNEYLDERSGGSRFAESWFPIKRQECGTNIFLHYGRISEGCITVKYEKENDNWTRLFLNLMLSRIDDRCVSEIEVV